jgi:coenzyme F420 hydrogenase subunit beta
MSVERVRADGLCTQCGTCAAVCPHDAVAMEWTLAHGWLPRVDGARCTECGTCLAVCPGRGLDYGRHAWWRAANEGAPAPDFLGPWSSLWFGWASDEEVRYRGASGGVATAILSGALADGLIDGAVVVRPVAGNALAMEPLVARSDAEIAACRGSKYTMVALNVALREVLAQPGRYAVAGLPCHIQGLRLAQRRDERLRERVVLTLGVFCGWNGEPRGTALAARRLGLDPAALVAVRYRGPGWPGGLRLETRGGAVREQSYADYYDADMVALTAPRCRLCPDGMAELADVSVGDAWLDRFAGSPGVSDLVVRTPAGEALVKRLAGRRLTLAPAGPREMLESQRETRRLKRGAWRGRLWLQQRRGRPVPVYPGLPDRADRREIAAGLLAAADEAARRALIARRYGL